MNENIKENEAGSQPAGKQAGIDVVEHIAERFRICPVSYAPHNPFITVKPLTSFSFIEKGVRVFRASPHGHGQDQTNRK